MHREPELIADYACVCGENPLWHADEGRVYWTDIDTGRLFRYSPDTGRHECFFDGGTVGGFTIQTDGSLLLFMDRGAVRIWRDGALTTLIESLPGEEGSRFNDVIADPRGRVFCGTMPTGDRPGSLYRLETSGAIVRVAEGVQCSNGLGFTLDRRRMYHTDTGRMVIWLYDYDEATGEIANRREFVRVPDGEGYPDGLTVDAEDCVWSARWDGNRIVRYSPDGEPIDRIDFPVRKVSSVSFGGPDDAELYVTTAGGDRKGTDGEWAGGLFRVRPGVRGVPEFRSSVGL